MSLHNPKKCKCKPPVVKVNDKHDAKFCETCDTWLETHCGDSRCGFCFGRPKKPSEAKN